MKHGKIEYTKIYQLTERVYRYFTCRFYPTALLFNRLYCIRHPEYHLFTGMIKDTNQYISEKKIQRMTLLPEEEATVYENVYFGDPEEQAQKYTFRQPEIYVSELSDVCVYGGAKLLTTKQEILEPVYTAATQKRWAYLNNLLKIHAGAKGTVRYKTSGKRFEKAISLCGSAGGNYYHFLVEVLPRLALIEEKGLYKDYPLLVESVIAKIPSLRDALNCVNISKHPVYYVDDNEAYYVNKLAYVSEVTLSPMNLKPGVRSVAEDFIFSVRAVDKVRELITKQMTAKSYKKIYVARYQSKNLRMKNDEEVANLCKKAGFELVFPEKMTFAEQVATFMGADYVIGCMGAAMTNTMFCKKGTQIYVIIPREHIRNLWSTFTNCMGNKMSVIDAKVRLKANYPTKDIFEADLQTVTNVLEKIKSDERANIA